MTRRGAHQLKRIAVFCGSQAGSDPVYGTAAAGLGRLLARRGVGVVYGGGRVGLMGRLADAALEAGGEVIGVIPGALYRREVGHDGVDELRVVGSMHERKQTMYDLADGFVALPGGLGTFEELLETLTWIQLGFHAAPCGLLNVAGYYDPLLELLDRAAALGFIRRPDRALLVAKEDPEALLAAFAAFDPRHRDRGIPEVER